MESANDRSICPQQMHDNKKPYSISVDNKTISFQESDRNLLECLENANVEVHYHGTTPDGTVFDSSVERGESISFPLNQVIQGWTEGVSLMKVGAKYKFFIPQELAYGSQPQRDPNSPIKPFMPLVFEVELIKIN